MPQGRGGMRRRRGSGATHAPSHAPLAGQPPVGTALPGGVGAGRCPPACSPSTPSILLGWIDSTRMRPSLEPVRIVSSSYRSNAVTDSGWPAGGGQWRRGARLGRADGRGGGICLTRGGWRWRSRDQEARRAKIPTIFACGHHVARSKPAQVTARSYPAAGARALTRESV